MQSQVVKRTGPCFLDCMITAKRSEGLTAKINTGRHELLSGVSESLGGQDEGPDPHEILQAALAACTVITVQMYADRKQWPLRSTDVQVEITAENKEGTRIHRQISFVGDLTEEQRQRLLTIANKCPIHRLLSGPVEIQTDLV